MSSRVCLVQARSCSGSRKQWREVPSLAAARHRPPQQVPRRRRARRPGPKPRPRPAAKAEDLSVSGRQLQALARLRAPAGPTRARRPEAEICGTSSFTRRAATPAAQACPQWLGESPGLLRRRALLARAAWSLRAQPRHWGHLTRLRLGQGTQDLTTRSTILMATCRHWPRGRCAQRAAGTPLICVGSQPAEPWQCAALFGLPRAAGCRLRTARWTCACT